MEAACSVQLGILGGFPDVVGGLQKFVPSLLSLRCIVETLLGLFG